MKAHNYKMNKKLIFSFGILIFLIFILSLNLISASGLCLGNDGYYHDCDDNRYFYDDYGYYYYHGKYYQARPYYYREYYRPRQSGSRYKDEGLTYKDSEEYKRTIEYTYEDRGRSEKVKTTINQKTEIELDYDLPYAYLLIRDLKDSPGKEDKTRSRWYSSLYEGYKIPYTYYWYGN